MTCRVLLLPKSLQYCHATAGTMHAHLPALSSPVGRTGVRGPQASSLCLLADTTVPSPSVSPQAQGWPVEGQTREGFLPLVSPPLYAPLAPPFAPPLVPPFVPWLVPFAPPFVAPLPPPVALLAAMASSV
jgi:hypothetical protein